MIISNMSHKHHPQGKMYYLKTLPQIPKHTSVVEIIAENSTAPELGSCLPIALKIDHLNQVWSSFKYCLLNK